MNWLDAIYFIIITITTINGLRKGFIQSLFGLIDLVISFTLAIKTYKLFSSLLVESFSMPGIIASILSFILIWFLSHTLISIISKELHKLTSSSFLAPLNITGGALFGFLKGFIYTLIITIILSNSFLSKNLLRIPLRESMFVNFSEPIIKIAKPYVYKMKKGDAKIDVRKYIPGSKKIKMVEETMDQLTDTKKTYRRISKELDF